MWPWTAKYSSLKEKQSIKILLQKIVIERYKSQYYVSEYLKKNHEIVVL